MTASRVIILALLLAFMEAAQADIYVDQSQLATSPGYTQTWYKTNGDWIYAQSFTPQYDSIAGAAVWGYCNWGDAELMTISIWDSLEEDHAVLATGDVLLTECEFTWWEVLWDPVAVDPGTPLYLTVSRSAGDDYTENLFLIISVSGNPYANGMEYLLTHYTTERKDYDLVFKTYYDDSFCAVPVPGAAMLGVLGLVHSGLRLRRRV